MKRKLQNITSTISPNIKKVFSIICKIVVPLIFIGIFFGIWQLIHDYSSIPSVLIPTPKAAFQSFFDDNKLIMYHTKITLYEALGGLACGVLVGFVLAVLMDACKIFNYGFKPLLVISQTIPTIVIAPIFVMWLGFGIEPKILICTLTTFFPIAVALSDGYQNTDKDMIDLMRAMGANKLKIFWFLKIPNALPNFFSGLKISTTYSVVAAVISEWVGATSGLGYYIPRAQHMYKYDTMFAIIMWIIVLSLLLMLVIDILKLITVKGEKK